MKIHSHLIGVLTAGCLVLTRHASAQVSTDDFNALKKTVEELGTKVQSQEQTHDQDQKTHEADQKKIESLQQQLGETRTAVTNVDQKAEAVAKVQSAYPVASGGQSATHNFTMVGDAEVQFGKTAGQNSAFALANFAPIFLFRASDNVLFEAGFDINLQNNAPNSPGFTTSVNLSFAQLDYLVNDYVTFVGGYMVLPLGTYSERAAGWLNKLPDDPLPRDLLPGSAAGVQLRGAVPVGQFGQMVTYSLYGVNGPGSVNGSGSVDQLDLEGNVGINSDGTMANQHMNPSGGGRIGWFIPYKPHYDLELGVSGQSGTWDAAGNLLWSAAVLDGAVHISPYFEVKGEYINTWQQTDNVGNIRPRGWWAQAGYKLAGLNLDVPYVSNVELIARYDEINNAQGTQTHRTTGGFVYYFSNTLLFEGDYEWVRGQSSDPTTTFDNRFVCQLSYGF